MKIMRKISVVVLMFYYTTGVCGSNIGNGAY